MSKKKKIGKWYDGLTAEEVQRQIDQCPKKKEEFMKWYATTPEYKKQYAEQYAAPATQAANTYITLKHKGEPLDYDEISKELTAQNKALRNNDLTRVEDILMAQAQTLDFLFHRAARKAAAQEYILQFKTHMDMAFKAQRQCRSTLETLAMIKNPQPYVRQQNLAYNQQVNNGIPDSTRTREKLKSTNELLEDRRHETEWLDTGTARATGGINQDLEAVEAINRPENS